LGLIARTISKFEPVTMLVRSEDAAVAERLVGNATDLVETGLDDLWIRDMGPSFVIGKGGRLGAVDLNFNGWGNKQEHGDDAQVAAFVARQTRAEHLTTDLVGEGGGIEVDGEGTAIISESCFLNENRNPGLAKSDCEHLLGESFGINRVVWLPGLRGQDITDGHTDFYARFTTPGVVVAALDMDPASPDYRVTREHLKILRAARDASGRQLEVVTLEAPTRTRREFRSKDFAAGYINFYVCNGAVVAPEFGDPAADGRCLSVLQRLFPKRTVVQLNIDGIAAGGGGIHCATQQEPDPARLAPL
jgi:agmatine deiminase